MTLVANLLEFGRVLRRAGLEVHHGRLIDAIRSLEWIGVERRADVRATLEVFSAKEAGTVNVWPSGTRLGRRGRALLQCLPCRISTAPSSAKCSVTSRPGSPS